VNKWDRFWAWYERHTTESLALTAFIIYIQIPHMVWAADLWLQAGLISNVHPILDFLFYGIDLVEIPLMVNVTMLVYSKIKKKKR
jgi:hypothetical protein|tara:strand:- start:438 stop:692 length:255 start_codon:yes stop_codon:yes gene_type:complete